jgi:hypothetical protein
MSRAFRKSIRELAVSKSSNINLKAIKLKKIVIKYQKLYKNNIKLMKKNRRRMKLFRIYRNNYRKFNKLYKKYLKLYKNSTNVKNNIVYNKKFTYKSLMDKIIVQLRNDGDLQDPQISSGKLLNLNSNVNLI